MKKRKEKIIVVCGQTASGKSALAVALAKHLGGEIISADSRQVYKGLDIGTEKMTKKEMEGIPHHLIDVASPKKQFTAADFKRLTKNKIAEIQNRGRIPILCGGTGFYIDAVLYDTSIPNVPPNAILRRTLSKKTASELFSILKKLDPKRARAIDSKNPRRLIRAIEIVRHTGKPVSPLVKKKSAYDALILGVAFRRDALARRISLRLDRRLRQGMVREVRNLIKKGVGHRRLQELGLEYRFISLYLQKKLSQNEMREKLNTTIRQYAKRQETWFKRNRSIRWIFPPSISKKAVALSSSFLKR
ncbi:MAG: tRNA (adenosine(37)-N6)-dimethylallyltransferase MiaA [Candidatus Sungbacteria bacterium RIFCSPLOWO2_02_FULL_47_9]|uniref:tRNA dimethylallyltransferase n=1 Tax=Candidatus Sungbacteria bacterium RIFCSPHIGHO2_01_FULL_47_32 TaxID=1802264 RepID=A0A1G2K684_9BACT|nr:MAG: tRNA dimethylallyltransferase [Parcubacteria group bacterium GW2011_GWA2_47_10]OGZ94071.1 MAG: tRNA (adenosine(37)-N6)-dimethylallyltransferase MiaA [Candidatus Sungbacteria bacterium RIFCSPHIGHO2_01_FULL_47_32]OGZ98508.1 MAG: tRNA (adenosine(37)-N6)-dimethylallyltransferase MiaA [Candidatus Sungbacteria bacterium RIFCSPHIGHO2_02_FULL_46_12]OHA05291.1 MAG: tRNA (adenosine(37)-N6)-dimethylallyltransferase MiaA [Candidatus Sungbacteria bacterium RIFCSPLOWO2_01_FULL_47_32]OHA11755.1 MAG: t